MKKIIIVACLLLGGCASSKDVNSGANPINRSLLIDTGFKLGLNIPQIPIPLPQVDLSYSLHFRRLSPQDEIDLELAKNGKWRPVGPPITLPPVGPSPVPSKGISP